MTTLRSLRDLLAVVPYLLGFQPADSVVLLALRGREFVFQVRADLPPLIEVPELAQRLAVLVRRQEPTSAVVVGYGPDPVVRRTVLPVRAAVEAVGVPVLDVLRVVDGRYWSYLCGEPACCPPQGTRFDTVPTPAVAEAVVAGYVALPSRAELARRFEPLQGAERAAVVAATRRARDQPLGVAAGCRAVTEAIRRQRAGMALRDDEVAQLTVALAHRRVRDHAWESVGGDLGTHIALWTELLRRGDPDLALAPATLLAFAAWRAGEGAVASIALSRALDIDPTDPMAATLARALAGGLTPMSWPVS